MASRDSGTIAIVALLASTNRKWSDIRLLLEESTPEELLARELPSTLLEDPSSSALLEAAEQIERLAQAGVRVTSPFGGDYPDQLLNVHDYPPVIFYRGDIRLTDSRAIAVVGTRRPSDGALRFIEHTVPMLARLGFPIASGLALGVDAAAMRASMREGNRTIGIIGTGINKYYPATNHDLQDEVADSHLLMSQFWPDAPPTKQTFPIRNHFMSAFSAMTLIVEAGENSGTRIQARAASKHGRPIIVTRAVLTQTSWAKEMVDKGFDVTVVATPEEAVDAVQAISERQAQPPVWSERPLLLESA